MIKFEVMSGDDLEYLYRLCESTMRTYTEKVWGSWNELEIREHFAQALVERKFECIMEDGVRVGAISVERNEAHYQLEQIFIEPIHQNRGLGEIVIQRIISKAEKEALPIRLRVLKPNPAIRFYERLGFVMSKATKERYFMEYRV